MKPALPASVPRYIPYCWSVEATARAMPHAIPPLIVADLRSSFPLPAPVPPAHWSLFCSLPARPVLCSLPARPVLCSLPVRSVLCSLPARSVLCSRPLRFFAADIIPTTMSRKMPATSVRMPLYVNDSRTVPAFWATKPRPQMNAVSNKSKLLPALLLKISPPLFSGTNNILSKNRAGSRFFVEHIGIFVQKTTLFCSAFLQGSDLLIIITTIQH